MGSKSALKQLKKLKKKTVKLQNSSLEQLQKLTGPHGASSGQKSSRFKAEVVEVSREAMISATRELAAPLSPVLSWFQGGSEVQFAAAGIPATEFQPDNTASQVEKSILNLPLKSPPCLKCPARDNGICKCAAKKFRATGS